MDHTPRNLEQLVEHQIRKWNLEGGPATTRSNGTIAYWPIITVSREYGAHGADVGRRVAERLDFAFWDKELVDAIAEETGASLPLLRSVDENERNAIDDFVRALVLGGRYMRSTYMEQLMRVVQIVAYHGRSVVVGRGAQYALEPTTTLRARIVAPRATRIAAVAERLTVDKKRAADLMDRFDRDRARFVHDHYHRRVDDYSSYDICLNSGTYGLEGAADLLVAAYHRKFAELPRRERPSRRAEVMAHVESRL